MSKSAQFVVCFEVKEEVMRACKVNREYARQVLQDELEIVLEDFMEQISDFKLEDLTDDMEVEVSLEAEREDN